MRELIKGITLVALVAATGNLPAVEIVQCEDAQGNRSFHSSCPPGTTAVDKKRYYTGPSSAGPDMQALQAEFPVTLYSIPECDACDLVRSYLQQRDIPFNETDVSDNSQAQERVASLSGELSVPVITVGEEVITGYNRPVLKAKLDAAGYPDASASGEAPAEGAEKEPPSAGDSDPR